MLDPERTVGSSGESPAALCTAKSAGASNVNPKVAASRPGPSWGERATASFAPQSQRRHEGSGGPEAHTGEPHNLELPDRDVERAEAPERERRIDHEETPERAGEVRVAVGLAPVRVERDAARATPPPRRRSATSNANAVSSGSRLSMRSAPQVTNASAAMHISASNTTPSARPGIERLRRSASPDPMSTTPASAATPASAGNAWVPDGLQGPDEAPGHEHRESELDEHPGAMLFVRRGALDPEDADGPRREDDHRDGEDADDQRHSRRTLRATDRADPSVPHPRRYHAP